MYCYSWLQQNLCVQFSLKFEFGTDDFIKSIFIYI